MKQNIHQTAIISDTAQIGDNVTIGAFTIIEDNVIIGDNTEIRSHCVIGAGTTIGQGNTIYASAVIGTEPQDVKYAGEKANVIIGDNNTIREFVTINNGTSASGKTVVGNKNLFLAYSHIAHDCVIGNNIIMSNLVQLGGHVHVEDWVVFGAYSKVHQFGRVGCHSMIPAAATITKDVPPYALIDRTPAFHSINRVGLGRRGFDPGLVREISNFYQVVFHSGLNNADGIKKYIAERDGVVLPEIQHCIDFIVDSERGVLR